VLFFPRVRNLHVNGGRQRGNVRKYPDKRGHCVGSSAWCSVGITGLVAGVIAVPAGITLHHNVLPAMAHAANSGLPTSVISVFSLPEMTGLALAGLVIAVAGALAPATWAARSRTAAALRTE
jgi:ABC-type lipoprotein release transport system permease subunit